MPQQPVQQLIKINHWMRKSTINFFNRNPDAVFAPGFLTLCHPMVVDIFSKSFEAVSRDTYFVTCRARMILSENLKTKVYHE